MRNKNQEENTKHGEVVFTNYKLEFQRFFNTHKNVCDKICGLKPHDENQSFFITRDNFIYAIKNLDSFINDYIHYIEDDIKKDQINNDFEKLNEDYQNDIKYQQFQRGKDELSTSQDIEYNKLYINYIIRCFEIAYLVSKYLQNSLNIAPREIIKNFQYVDYSTFFNNLSTYRDEVVREISNLSMVNLFNSYKKILSFYYTYRYLINIKLQYIIDDAFKELYHEITDKEVIRLIIKIKESSELTPSFKNSINKYFKPIRRLIIEIYKSCNKSFSKKNILPKTTVKVLIDKTLI